MVVVTREDPRGSRRTLLLCFSPRWSLEREGEKVGVLGKLALYPEVIQCFLPFSDHTFPPFVWFVADSFATISSDSGSL